MSNNSRQRQTHRTTTNTLGVSHRVSIASTTEHTDNDAEITCPDCDGSIDHTGTEHTCVDCGLVVGVDDIDHGPEWRSFEDTDEAVRRVGSPRSVRHHDHGLTTTMDVSRATTTDRRDLYRQQQLNQRARHETKKSRNKERGLREISCIGARLELPDSTVDRALGLVRKSMEQVGIDPETGEFDADVVETGQSKSQRDRRNQLVAVIEEKGGTTADELTNVLDMDRDKVDADIQALKGQGMIYEMQQELRMA